MSDQDNIHSADFETLTAQFLCGELDAQGKAALEKLLRESPELMERFRRYSAMQRALDMLPPGDLEPAADRVVSGRFKRAGMGLAAAAVLAVAFGAYYFSRESPERTLAFPHGRCSSEGRPLAAGGTVGKDIESGEDSVCDLKLSEGGEIAARVLPGTRVSFDSRPDALHIYLERGGIVIDAQKRSSQGLQIDAPGSSVAILGTKVSVRHSQDRITVDLLEGRAEVRSGAVLYSKTVQTEMTAEDLRSLGREDRSLEVKSVVLEPGSTAEVPLASPEDAAAISSGIESRAERVRLRDTRAAALKEAVGTSGPAASIQTGPMSGEQRSQFERSLLNMGRPQDPRPAIRGESPSPESRKPPEPAMPGPAGPEPERPRHRILLRNGSVISGMAEQEGDNYRVETPSGVVVIPQSEVESIEIQK